MNALNKYRVATVWMKLFLWAVLRLMKAVSKRKALRLKCLLGCENEFIPLALKSYRTRSMENTQVMLNKQEIVIRAISRSCSSACITYVSVLFGFRKIQPGW